MIQSNANVEIKNEARLWFNCIIRGDINKIHIGNGTNSQDGTVIHVSGNIVQLPLPKHIDKQKVIAAISPNKDVAGYHPVNVGNLSSGYESTVPCTPLGCYLLIIKFEKNLSGK